MSLESVNTALEFLRKHGCIRDPRRGLWTTSSGAPLECGPIESAALLRRNMVSEHYRAAAHEGRMQTR